MNQDQIETISALTTVKECIEFETLAKSQKNLAIANAARERLYAIRIASLRTEDECIKFAKNAERLQRPDLVALSHRKSIELSIQKHPDYCSLYPVEIECLKAVYGYEIALTMKNGRTTKATYTWRSIKDHGIIESVNRIVSKPTKTMGFNHLSKIGLTDYSFEAIVKNHKSSFTNKTVEQAQLRLP